MSRKILMIDDDRLQFRVTQAHLKSFQTGLYEIEWAPSYDEGLEKLCSNGYAACLLDYQLGERDGLQLIHEAAKRGCRTPIVFLTAETEHRIDVEAMNAGALDFLVKGEITPRALERSLRYALKLGETLEALRELATHDPLTGLLNRREFDRILDEEMDRASRFGHSIALIMVDVDHFKQINDQHGHLIGDMILRELAKRLTAAVRTVDRVARFGGEEFGLILVQSHRAAALEVARRACAAVRADGIAIDGSLKVKVTVSAGVAALPQNASTVPTLIAAADRALYKAKHNGRDSAVAAE